jgi:DNA mismatch repair protein MutL
MGKIIELNKLVSNQIAAGEVIERPSSVIKELLENAIDAGAHNIEVRIKNGGLSQMIVQDDGMGMDEPDVVLSLKRYATSKLKSVNDLNNMTTFGFRGEALPSIASISHMSIISRMKEHAHGTKLIVDGGEIVELSKTGAIYGTRVEVNDLFFNVLPRLKFIKSKRVETSEIDRLIRAYAFIYQDIGWKFFADDKLVFVFLPTDDQTGITRALALLGKNNEGYLYQVNLTTDLINVSGVVAAPMVARRDTRNMIFFVNNRLVQDKKLVIAIKAAFRTLIEMGLSPVCGLKINIAPSEVDVNVHPRKTEVRFRDEKRVISHLINSLGEFLAKTPWLCESRPNIDDSIKSFTPSIRVSGINKTLALPKNSFKHHDKAFEQTLVTTPKISTNFGLSSKENHYLRIDLMEQKKLLPTKKFSDLRVIGQAKSTYLLAESEEGLVILDQHAAHERVVFEKIRQDKKTGIVSIPLLIPITIELESFEMALFLDVKSEFNSIGIEVDAFGEFNIVVRTLPEFIKNNDIKRLVLDLLADFSQHGRADSTDEILLKTMATLACHGSIRAGQKMSNSEIESLLQELDKIEFSAHCPHGRPIVKSIALTEMKKWFDRP